MKFSFYTLGCKVNQYETNALKEIVLEKGHQITDDNADALVINTCTVTAVSDKKNIKLIKKLKKENPDAIIAVCGCFAEISPEKATSLDVDIVCGTKKRSDVIAMCEQSFETSEKFLTSEKNEGRFSFEVLPVSVHSEKTRGLVKVQDGCDNFCAYCIIPYARGRSRSMPMDEVIHQVETLSKNNVLEVVVTGIEIASYGKDIGENLLNLLKTLCEKFPNMRFRLGSLEPRVVTRSFCETLSKFENLNPHFHLSLQSGCDEILRKMNRKYTTDDFYNVCVLLREFFENPSITTDLIVGFPEETDENFENTLAFIEKCKFSSMHIFPYSIREGTKASTMTAQIDTNIKNERAKRATALATKLEHEFLTSYIGKNLEIIVETIKNDTITGHTKYHFTVNCKNNGYNKGEKITLTADELIDNNLISKYW